MKIEKWIISPFGRGSRQPEDTDEMIEFAGRCMDKACVHDIVGDCVFKAEDGKTYVGTIEFVLSECNPDYLENLLGEQDDPDDLV